jgi:peptidoglycan glycosyltransferase
VNAPLRRIAGVVTFLFACLFLSSTYVQFVEADTLNNRPGNARALYRELGRPRGPIVVGPQGATVLVRSVPVEDPDPYAYQRVYPGGALYAPVTGYFSVVYGATGLEQAVGDLLSGTADQLFYRRLSDLFTGAEPQGASVELTIDPAAQRAAWDALGDQRGAVVALDPRTGEILAMVSKPSYDPDLLATQNTERLRANRQRLLDDPDEPLVNRAIAGDLYPPGSVFKLVTAAAALSDGRFTPQTELPGPAELDLPQTTVTLPNATGRACGPGNRVTFTDAMRESCNTAFGSLGLTLGADAMREQAERFGFGRGLSVPLGVTPSTFPDDPNPPQLAQSAIGQFDVRVTPLQVAMVSAGIANGGVVMQPNLVRTVRAADTEVVSRAEPRPLSTAVDGDVARGLTEMMEAVVSSGTGTRAQIPGLRVAGKTGTAQQGGGRPPHAWFTSFAPADDPQVAVAVVVESGGTLGDEASGGRLAAPVARAVMEAVIDR